MIEDAVAAPAFTEFMEYVAAREPRLHRWAVRNQTSLQAAYEDSLSRSDVDLAAYDLAQLLRALSVAARPQFGIGPFRRPFRRPCCSKRPFIYPFCNRSC